MIKKFLDLGMQPLANKYLTKKDIIKKTIKEAMISISNSE